MDSKPEALRPSASFWLFATYIPFASLAKEGDASSYADFNVAAQLNSFKAFILIFGAVLGGGLKVAGSGGAFDMYGEMSLVLAFVSVTFILAICAVNYAIVRKLSRGVRKGGWKSAALASGLHALVLALLFLIISLFGKLSFEGGEMISASVSPRYAGVFFTIALACSSRSSLLPRPSAPIPVLRGSMVSVRQFSWQFQLWLPLPWLASLLPSFSVQMTCRGA